MVKWLAKAMEDCLRGAAKDFYSTVHEGNHSFITQRCSNTRGRCMAIVEYGGGSRRSLIIVLDEVEGKGWEKMMEVLWDFVYKGKGMNHNRGKVSTVAVP